MYQKYKLPIIITGGLVYDDNGIEAEISKQSLVVLGIPKEDIIVESNSRSTKENAKFVKEIIDTKGFTLPILVTSALHMPRSVYHFDSENITVTPYPTAYISSKRTHFDIGKFLPSYDSVNKTGHAMKEYVGLIVLKYLGIY